MTFEQLRIFTAVVTEGTERDAAAKLFMSQPAVSQQIRGLERQVGVPLFYRSSKGKRLIISAAGQVLYAYTVELLDQHDMVLNKVRHMGGALHEWLKIGASYSSTHWLAPIIASFQSKHEQCRLTLETADPSFLVPQLYKGKFDVIVAMAPLLTAGLVQKKLFLDPVVAVVAPDHPLAQQETVHPTELASYRLLLPLPENHFRSLLHNFLLSIGISQSSNILEVGDSESARKLVSLGVGISFMFHCAVYDQIQNNELIPLRLSVPIPKVQFILVHKKMPKSNSAVGEFVKELFAGVEGLTLNEKILSSDNSRFPL